jgi:hypothetical protein
MSRWRAVRPATTEILPRETAAELPLSLPDRRARAATRAWRLMATSIPTREILESYLDDVLATP